ncbi:putative ketoacyl reductase [wastewater metagenome]|uniref:Putative ketoacyl reductase n=2 Tax=unclassified sequences TaxID=12908 RepID=A0A5B8RCA0_9ZZZZ|nr:MULTISPECIES: SDR family oxidoreductase [Arhodomonas]MCS4502577.1 SDR family oxidoreductase [Arhodomonas aquaeolei]QEA04405.1 putative ketoacyl reductase [uncultured organism]
MEASAAFTPPSGLRVLVTAGAAGIGRVVADELIDRGARVWVCDVSDEALAEFTAAHPEARATRADVARDEDVQALVGAVREAWGGLDVLVNNAGIAGDTGGVDEIDPESWRRTVDINLNGQFYCAHHAAPMLRESGGVLVNMASVAGRLGYAYRTPYSATKWAIVGFTQSLAKELGPDGVRVNAILPGIVRGPRMERVISARAEAVGVSYEEMEAEYLARISLRRMVEPQDVAHMVVFLCAPAGRNISGQALSVCGNVETL